MAEEIFKLILSTESPDNFRQWFLDQFQQESKVTIEEFAVYFLNFIRNQTDEYNKNSTTSFNTVERSTAKPSTSESHSILHKSINDSRSFNDSRSSCFDTCIGMRSSYDKSRDNRSSPVVSNVCLGDFLTSNASKKQSQKVRKSINSTERSSPTNAASFTAHENDFPDLKQKNKPNRTSASTPSSMTSSPSLSSLSLSTSELIATSTPKSTKIIKPKKRVTPLRISTNEINCTSFRNDNNILELSHEANGDCDDQRDLLKSQKDMIRQVFQDEQMPNRNLRLSTKVSADTVKNVPPIDLNQITDRPMLMKFIDIYSIVLDLNLVTNILSEVAYLVNLINLDVNEYYIRNPNVLNCNSTNDNTAIDQIHVAALLLKNINNCIYFSLGVLKLQINILCMLDVTSIKLLLENQRLATFDSAITEDLKTIHTHKMQLTTAERSAESSSLLVSNSSMKVFYQKEQDTQMYFPSTRESIAFKKQRDQFYRIFEAWESKRFNLEWNFEAGFGDKVRSMLTEMEHPINMAHMAKLFTAQLILSCNLNDVIQSDDVPNIDPKKLNNFNQRFIAPSVTYMNYQFSGNQTFFKDFIIAAEHHTNFIEQLKIILTNELIDMNDSTYETLNLSTIDENANQREYIVKPETMYSLNVLAKFLGLILARPFIYNFGQNQIVDNRQVELRNKIRTSIDIKDILIKSIINRKLIVTLPWMVQFISMLDPVGLRTKYYRDVFNSFYEIYALTAECQTNSLLSMRQTSIFIIRTCLGWLFDQSHVQNEYYLYRQNRQQLKASNSELTSLEIIVNLAAKEIDSAVKIRSPLKLNDEQQILTDKVKLSTTLGIHSNDKKTDHTAIAFDPLLEAILPVACPFLADFRASIMPRRNSKTVSCHGRYLYITPYTSVSSATTAKATSTSEKQLQSVHHQSYTEIEAQNKLADAFLRAQSLLVQRAIETVQMCVSSNVEKLFEMDVLIPFKNGIVESIDKIQLKDSNTILNELYKIYSNGEKELLKKWQHFVQPTVQNKVKIALDVQLPLEMVEACKLACINIAIKQALTRTDEWRSKNLKGIDIFTKDIHADVEKVLKNTTVNRPQMQNTFHIDSTKQPPWKTINNLQNKLSQLSMHPKEICDTDEVNEFCAEIRRCISEHVLPDSMYQTIGNMTVHFMLLLISNRHDLVTIQAIDQFISLWQCKQFAMFVRPPSTTTETTAHNEQTAVAAADLEFPNQDPSSSNSQSNLIDNQTKNIKLIDTNYMFSLILSPLHIMAQQHKSSESFEKLAKLMEKLIKNRLMTISFVNNQCMKLMHMEWEQSTLKSIAQTIQSIIDYCRNTISSASIDDENDASFLKILANLISNMECS